MAKPTFETFIQEERERLAKTREALLAKRAEIDDQLSAADRELYAITAYEQAKQGKLPTAQGPRKPRAPSTRAPRGERGKLREQIKELVASFSDGLAPEGIMQELGADTEQTKRPIHAALNAMKNDGTLSQERKRGPYKLAPARREPQPEAP
jgi:hypothetical protein